MCGAIGAVAMTARPLLGSERDAIVDDEIADKRRRTVRRITRRALKFTLFMKMAFPRLIFAFFHVNIIPN